VKKKIIIKTVIQVSCIKVVMINVQVVAIIASNSGIFEIREVDTVYIFGRHAILCSGVTFFIVLETGRIHVSAEGKKT